MPSIHDQIAAHEAASQYTLPESMHERARQLKQVCCDAAALERVKRANGFPRWQPAPWPASTWQILAKHACYRGR